MSLFFYTDTKIETKAEFCCTVSGSTMAFYETPSALYYGL